MSDSIKLKPSCKYCKKPLVKTDEDWLDCEEELDKNEISDQSRYLADQKIQTLRSIN